MVFVNIVSLGGAVATGGLDGVGDVAFGFYYAAWQGNDFDVADIVSAGGLAVFSVYSLKAVVA